MIIAMRLLVAFASVFTLALAQSSVPQFTSVPSNISCGLSYTISWAGGDGSVSFDEGLQCNNN